MDYVTVYDVGESWFRHWWLPASGLAFLVIGLLMFMVRDNIESRSGRVFVVAFPAFAGAWTFLALGIVAMDYFGLASDLRNGRCEVVEGVVTQFEPWSDAIKNDETFVVGGHRFHYSDFTITAGFNNTQVHGAQFTKDCRLVSTTVETTSQSLRSHGRKNSLPSSAVVRSTDAA